MGRIGTYSSLLSTLSFTRRNRKTLPPSDALESRLLLTGGFDGIYVGSFQGSATAFGTTIQIPSDDFPDNQILSVIENDVISNRLPGTGTGTVTEGGEISYGTIAQIFGFELPIEYQGQFTPGNFGTFIGTGTWSIGANGFGVTGSGTWNSQRQHDAPGAVAGSTFRLDSNNNRIWNAPTTGDSAFKIGNATDIPVAGRWVAGTLFDNVGMFRNGQWFLDTGNQKYEGPLFGDLRYNFGSIGDLPVVGDWDGDGDDDIGVYRAGKFYLDANGNHQWDGTAGGDLLRTFGNPTGDLPVVGDWNGDGVDDIGIFRNVATAGRFYLDTNGNGSWSGPATDATFIFGNAGDKPVSGDWNGNGIDDIGVVRGGSWYLDQNGNRAWNGAGTGDIRLNFGSATDTPLVGIWKPNQIPLLPPPPVASLPAPASGTAAFTASNTLSAGQLASLPKPKVNSHPVDELFAELGNGSLAV